MDLLIVYRSYTILDITRTSHSVFTTPPKKIQHWGIPAIMVVFCSAHCFCVIFHKSKPLEPMPPTPIPMGTTTWA